MNFDPALLDELGKVFVEAAMRRIELETMEIDVVVGHGDGHVAHLDRRDPAATYEIDVGLDEK